MPVPKIVQGLAKVAGIVERGTLIEQSGKEASGRFGMVVDEIGVVDEAEDEYGQGAFAAVVFGGSVDVRAGLDQGFDALLGFRGEFQSGMHRGAQAGVDAKVPWESVPMGLGGISIGIGAERQVFLDPEGVKFIASFEQFQIELALFCFAEFRHGSCSSLC